MTSRRRVLKWTGAGIGGMCTLTGGYLLQDRRLSNETEGAVPADLPRPPGRQTEELHERYQEPAQFDEAIYVSPDGNDQAAGTRQEPLGTLEAAVDDVEPGDDVYLRGGTYDRVDSVIIEDLEGTAEDPITIAGYPGERPIFRFEGPTPGGWDAEGGLVFSNIRYLSIQNMTVRNSPSLGIRVDAGSEHNHFEDIETVNNNLVGFGIYDESANNTVRNVTSAYNYDPQNEGSDADGVQFAQTTDNTIVGGKFYNNSDDGLDLWESHNIEVRHCLSWQNGRGGEGSGTGFKLGGGDDSGGHHVVRNVAFNNNVGFTYNGATQSMTLYNNTAWSAEYCYSFYSSEHELVNNIAYDADANLGEEVESSTNTWDLDIENPQFVSYAPTDDRFLHPSTESPCIDAGTDVGLAYWGTGPDLGAYELGRGRD